jgi:hypothetical protein
MMLEAAVAGRVDAVVSGDNDLLTLKSFEGIPILAPAAFLKMLKVFGIINHFACIRIVIINLVFYVEFFRHLYLTYPLCL